MCEFHSFLYDCYTGKIFDSPGEVSHSAIAEKAGVDQDDFLLPEFHLAERRLDFDGAPLEVIINTTSTDSNVRSLIRTFAARKWQRNPWNQQALDRLERYLKRHFGSPERLVDFVEPQWDVAGPHCARLLNEKCRPKTQAKQIALSPADVDITVYYGPLFTGALNVRASAIHWKLRDLPPNQADALRNCLFTGEICSLRYGGTNYPPTIIAEIGPVGPNILMVRGMLVQKYQDVDFNDWKKLFLKARENRIETWQEDPVEMLV